MFREPRTGELALVHADVVADEVDGGDLDGCSAIDLLEQLDKLRLTLAPTADPDHLARASVERRHEVRGPAALVFVLHFRGLLAGGRLGGSRSGSRLDRRLLVDAKYALMGEERSCVQVLDVEHGRLERRVQGRLRTEPVVDSPRLEFVREQDALDRLRRDGLDDAFSLQSPRELCAGPQRQ